jgi:hypothetical protein
MLLAGRGGFFLPFLLHSCNNITEKGGVMEKITDPLIGAGGRIYSLRGLKLLLGAVTKDGRTVTGVTKKRRPERRVHCGKI